MLTPDEGSPVKSLAQRHAEAAEQRRIESEAWVYCCRLSEKEKLSAEVAWKKSEDDRIAGLHLMRILDRRFSSHGIFIGSYTRKYLVHPELGEMPQLVPEVDLTGDSSSCSSL